MRRLSVVICLTLFVFIFNLSNYVFASEKKVVLISSYHASFPSFFKQLNGLKSVLDPAGIALDIEFMDSKRLYSPENISAFYDLLKLKLKEVEPYNVVVTADDNALKFVLEFHDELFPSIPVVFCGVNDQKFARSMNLNEFFTGVIEEVSMRETLDIAFELFPEIQNIYAIGDAAPSAKADIETYEKQKSLFPHKNLKTLSLKDLTWNGLADKLDGLSSKDGILLLSAYSDKKGTGKLFDESLNLIVSHSKVPIFHLWEHGLGNGLFGGKVISQFEQGAVAGKISLDIINGEQVKDIAVVEGRDANSYLFDYNILKHFGIGEDSLPVGSTILNEPYSALRNHQTTILIVASLIIMLLVFIVVLGFYVLRLRKAEEKISKSEKRFALAMEANRDGLWDWEIDTNTVYYSPNYKMMLGYKKDEVPSHVDSWIDLIHPADKDAAIKGNMDCIENKTNSFEVEFRMQAKNGQWLWILGRGKAVERHENGRAIRVVGTHTNITDRKNVEKELLRLRNYLTDIINSMPSILIGLDHNKKVTKWNSEAQRVTGLSSAEAEGRSLSEVFPKLSPQLDRIKESLSKHEVHTEPRTHWMEKGEDRFVDITIYPLYSNGVEGVVIRVDDVTHRVHLEEMIVQNEKMVSIGHLAAGMAHEINNPLGSIVQGAQNLVRRLSADLPANLETAERRNIDFDNLQGYLEDRSIFKIVEGISRSGMRAGLIVTNMLSFCRKSGKSAELHDLSELLSNALELEASEYDLGRKFDFRKIVIKREYEQNVPPVYCEGNEIQQVFLNLIKNGAYAMMAKTYIEGSPTLTLRLRLENNMVVIEVEDNGLGMDELDRRRAFEPFFTTKPTGDGTGLGLSISYYIITEQHHGNMEVFSSPGNWTRFVIKLPINQNC